eukprot:1496575-Rhodomonas_salina.2
MWALAPEEEFKAQTEEREIGEEASTQLEDKWTWDDVSAPTPAVLISRLVMQRQVDTDMGRDQPHYAGPQHAHRDGRT